MKEIKSQAYLPLIWKSERYVPKHPRKLNARILNGSDGLFLELFVVVAWFNSTGSLSDYNLLFSLL